MERDLPKRAELRAARVKIEGVNHKGYEGSRRKSETLFYWPAAWAAAAVDAAIVTASG